MKTATTASGNKPMWYAHITLNRDVPPRPCPGVLHLLNVRTAGPNPLGQTDVTTAADFATFVVAHPEIGTVTIYDSRFPQRPVSWVKFVEKHACKIWPEAELLAAFENVQRKRMADPNYVPTLDEALRYPAEFVEGMTEFPSAEKRGE